jgi:hypothetical protein
MRELTSFHAAQRGLSASTYGGDCGCGCNNCGEYAEDVTYGAPWHVSWPWWAWQKDKYAECPGYKKAVDEWTKARERAISKHGAVNWPVLSAAEKSDWNKLQSIEKRGKSEWRKCKSAKKAAEEGIVPIDTSGGTAAEAPSAGDEEFKAALQQVAQSGGGGSASEGGGLDTKTLLIIGGVAVLGLGALFVLRKPAAPKKKAAAPAAAPVAAPAVVA